MRDGREDRVAQVVDPLALGDVLPDPHHAHRHPALVGDDPARCVDPAHRVVGQHDPVLEVERRRGLAHVFDDCAHPVAIGWVNGVEIALVRQGDQLRLEAPEAVELVRPRDPVRADVPLPAAEVRDLLGLRQARIGRCELTLSSAALCEHGAQDEQADGDARGQAPRGSGRSRSRSRVPPARCPERHR